jgi:hypothetical protein
MSRPEHTAPPEIFYNEAEAAKVLRAVARIRHAMTRCCAVHLELPHDRYPNAARRALPAAPGHARRHGGIYIPSRLRPQLIFAARACARPTCCHNVIFFQCNNAPQDALLLDIGCGRCVYTQPPPLPSPPQLQPLPLPPSCNPTSVTASSGLSGEVITEAGLSWMGLDISPAMLAIAAQV